MLQACAKKQNKKHLQRKQFSFQHKRFVCKKVSAVLCVDKTAQCFHTDVIINDDEICRICPEQFPSRITVFSSLIPTSNSLISALLCCTARSPLSTVHQDVNPLFGKHIQLCSVFWADICGVIFTPQNIHFFYRQPEPKIFIRILVIILDLFIITFMIISIYFCRICTKHHLLSPDDVYLIFCNSCFISRFFTHPEATFCGFGIRMPV